MTQKCIDAFRRKAAAKHTDDFATVAQSCSKTLAEAYDSYIDKTKAELKQMPKHSKRWWQLSNALIDNAVPRKGIPPWKSEHGCWLYDGKAKANNFATTFCSKYNLPDDFADFDYHSETEPCIGFLILRRRWALKVLRDLRTDQATCPDRLPAAILHHCANQLAIPIIIFARICLRDSRWPKLWKFHWISPLHTTAAITKAFTSPLFSPRSWSASSRMFWCRSSFARAPLEVLSGHSIQR